MSKRDHAFSVSDLVGSRDFASPKREVVPLGLGDGATPGRLRRTCLAPSIDPLDEAAFWRTQHRFQRFATGLFGYEDFAPAYRCGVDQFLREPFLSFTKAETCLEQLWPRLRGSSRLPWKQARFAARASWERAQRRAYAIASER